MHFAVEKAAGINSHRELHESAARSVCSSQSQSMPFAPKNAAVKRESVEVKNTGVEQTATKYKSDLFFLVLAQTKSYLKQKC